MEQFDGILKLAGAELDSIVKNGKFRSREEIDSVGKLIDLVKDIHCIWEYEDEESGGYSENDGMSYAHDGRSMNRGGGRRGGSYAYDDGSSYARGRRGNVRRDSMGRYSRDGGSYRDGGYSRGGDKQEYIENLRDMMNDAPDDATRQSIQRMIQQMEQG